MVSYAAEESRRMRISIRFSNIKVTSYLDKSSLEQIRFKLALKSLGGEKLESVSTNHSLRNFPIKEKRAMRQRHEYIQTSLKRYWLRNKCTLFQPLKEIHKFKTYWQKKIVPNLYTLHILRGRPELTRK